MTLYIGRLNYERRKKKYTIGVEAGLVYLEETT